MAPSTLQVGMMPSCPECVATHVCYVDTDSYAKPRNTKGCFLPKASINRPSSVRNLVLSEMTGNLHKIWKDHTRRKGSRARPT